MRTLVYTTVLLALATGTQSATARRVAVPDLNTMVVTETLTGLATDRPDPNIARLTCEVLAKYHVRGKARIALWEALIQESGVNNLPYGHSSSVGVLQALDIHGSFEQRMDAEWQIEVFLFKGWASPPGAIGYARQHPEATPGQITQHVQQSADGSLYDPHYGQAVALNPDSSAPKHAKVLSKPFHLRELVNEVSKMLAAA